MAYPGDGQNMSNYGKQVLSPFEKAGHWKECIRQEALIHQNHLATKGNGTTIWPGTVVKEQELLAQRNTTGYYDKLKEHAPCCTYDRLFHVETDFNSMLHRDDREHTVGLDIQSEELGRQIPVLSSTEYGRRARQPLEQKSGRYARMEEVQKGFYRTRGTGIPSGTE